MPWACSSSMVLSPSERFRAPVQPRDHDHVAGLERLPERRPRRAAHVPARGHVGEDAVVPEPVVGEDAALGGQPARALRLGDPDVAEYRWVHGATSPHDKQPPVCLPSSSGESIRIWARWQSTAGDNHQMEKTGVRGLYARRGWSVVPAGVGCRLMAAGADLGGRSTRTSALGRPVFIPVAAGVVGGLVDMDPFRPRHSSPLLLRRILSHREG